MKRYLIFAFNMYYPSGGWNDFQGSRDTFEDALSFTKQQITNFDYVQIVDSVTGEKWDAKDIKHTKI